MSHGHIVTSLFQAISSDRYNQKVRKLILMLVGLTFSTFVRNGNKVLILDRFWYLFLCLLQLQFSQSPWRLRTGDRRQEAGDRRQETGDWCPAWRDGNWALSSSTQWWLPPLRPVLWQAVTRHSTSSHPTHCLTQHLQSFYKNEKLYLCVFLCVTRTSFQSPHESVLLLLLNNLQ